MEPDNRRILIAAAISAGILVLWQVAFPPPKQARHAVNVTADAGQPSVPEKAPAPVAPGSPAPTPGAAAAVPVNAPEELAVLETPQFKATFSSHGGALKSYLLKGEKFQKDLHGAAVPVDLVRQGPGEPLPLSLSVAGPEGLATDPAARAPMKLVSHDDRSVVFEGAVGPYSVRKRFELGAREYEIRLALQVSGGAGGPGAVTVLYPGWVDPNQPKPGFFSGGAAPDTVQPVCRAGDKTVRFGGKEPIERVPGVPGWAGLDQHYFVSVLLPTNATGDCVFAKGLGAGGAMAALRVPVPGAGLDAGFDLFAGPKQLDLLRSYGRGLDSAIDYGTVTNLFAFFARILLWVMRAFEHVVHNWGVAIMLLTLVVKALLYPLTHRSMQSMAEVRRLQPEVDKLKAKHGDDKEKLNLAVMQLYQQHKVNPLGGCLPLLLQMPVWLALYATLQTSVELYREPFLWIHDLTLKDPYYILPIAMGLSSFVMQKISPQPADAAQAKMMLYFMPIFLTFIMMNLAAGLTLYILVNNVLSIAQQQVIMRRQAAVEPAKA
ncbi:membrane protein insertase YidC [Anaeromyxobacter paludicola]|uniref:Membrane protein insertase YidC n=1 Tax=Anaeromyxobacter paludicola TaxID=2918171 RepID=A0ABN6N8Y7_9BACT|nr:membrane protein insertase YidC [Anaeromyxobacter paludicola]BDG09716.1 membrane protein insertase YidC [Anaeromyxobacter paludicola]